VSVSRGSRYSKLAGVRVYETRRRKPEDVLDHGLPRVRPEIAAVRAALWAVSNRQAALLWLMPIQQRILGAEALSEAFASVKRHRRRSFLRTVLADLVNGVQSMGELDFARMCRARGLPEPTRQVVRRGLQLVQIEEGGALLQCELLQWWLEEGLSPGRPKPIRTTGTPSVCSNACTMGIEPPPVRSRIGAWPKRRWNAAVSQPPAELWNSVRNAG
jgi:hypothetical protein